MSPAPFVRYQDKDLQEKHNALFQNSRLRPFQHVLPPETSWAEFERLVGLLKETVGSDAVFTGDSLVDYIDPFQLREEENQNIPSAAVCPRSVAELQSILKLANQYKVPLWTCSRGKNLGYGGPAPIVSGSIVLDLHRMNQILEVNEKFAYAVVEPGVTFFDLYNHCRDNKLGLWPSVPSLGWGSVLGNAVDRGFGYTPLGEHHQHICGMEVVLPNGEIVRTGQFAMSNSQTAHMSKLSFGPSIEGLFLQSNLGVVTRLGIWLLPQPQAFMSCTLDMDEPEDIATLVDVLGDLRRQDILQNNPVVRNIIAWSSMMGRREDLWTGKGPIPHWKLQELQKKLELGYWMSKFGFYGPKNLVEQRFAIVKKVVEEGAPKARLKGFLFEGQDGGRVDAASIPTSLGGGQVGLPDMWTLPSVQYRCPKDGSGIGAHTDYSPILPPSGKAVLEWFNTAKKIVEAEGFDIYCGGHIFARHMILINMMVFNKRVLEEQKAVETIFFNLASEGKKRGYSKYRSHINNMDVVADMYDFNDHAYRRFVEGIKDHLDPNGILSPGKQGIWPARLRKSVVMSSKL